MNIFATRGFRFVLLSFIGVATISPVRCDDWIELRTPHFTVFSEASESRTRAWATEFELFRRAMMIVMPVDPSAVEPVTLVLFRSDRRLRPFKPVEGGKPSKVAGFFARSPGRACIAIAIDGARDDVREVIFHEGVHWHLASSDRALPLWLEEGLAGAFGNFRLSGNSFVVGSHRPEYMRYVGIAKPMPFEKMAAADFTGLKFNGQHAELTELFYCQSWLLVHALFFGVDGVGYLPLAQYVGGRPSDDDFTRDLEKGLGISVATLDKRMADYMAGGRFRTLTFPFDRTAVEAGFALRRPSAAEVDLMLGNLLVGVGRPADAEPYLLRALAGMPADVRPVEALAAMHLWQNRIPQALERYREAFRRGHESYLGHFVMARSALREAYSNMPVSLHLDVRDAIQHLAAALRLNRRFVLGYEAMSPLASLLRGEHEEVERIMTDGATRYPANPRIQLGLALTQIRRGKSQAARDIAQKTRPLILPEDDIARALLKEVEAELAANGASTGRALASATGLGNAFAPPPVFADSPPRSLAYAPRSIGDQLQQARRLKADGKAADARVVLEALHADPLAASKRGEIAALQREIEWEIALADAERMLEQKQSTDVSERIRAILADQPPDNIRTRAEGLLGRASATTPTP